jgi:hypothetical protein
MPKRVSNGHRKNRVGMAATAASTASRPAPVPLNTTRVSTQAIPVVHFHENDPGSRRDSTAKRAEPIGETPRPARNAADDIETRVAQVGSIVEWLASDRSARYLPHFFTTFCNVYASDFCYMAGAYLPRVWWTDTALTQIAQGHTPAVVYDSTIREMRADDLYAWLGRYGPRFGWRTVSDPGALQDAANAGGVAVICADRADPGRPGHITMVVPETAAHRAVRGADGRVTLPLQTQAGATNFQYGTVGRPWWQDAEYRSFVMAVHD